MRIKSFAILLGLAIIAGSTLAADARSSGGTDNPGTPGRDNPTEQTDRPERAERPDPDEGDGESNQNRRRNCYTVGAAAIDCPPKKRPLKQTREGDCHCKPVAMLVGGTTRIVLDCYQTKMINNIERTYVCAKPE